MKEDDKKEKILTQLEIENILDETINLLLSALVEISLNLASKFDKLIFKFS